MGPRLILVLGDQLTPERGALRGADPQRDIVVMAEVATEASYVRHNRHKIALIFAAMRHFRQELESTGFTVIYFDYSRGMETLLQAVEEVLSLHQVSSVRCCEPGEYRLLSEIKSWCLSVPMELVADDRFLCRQEDFSKWADGKKQLRMEYFYRSMRREYDLLLDAEGAPEGGKWNYDAQNRKGWRGQRSIPSRLSPKVDDTTQTVIDLVQSAFPDHPGDLENFYLATTREGAEQCFQWFLNEALVDFGCYQDAIAEESPYLFHSLISMYLNIGLLDPVDVCRRVEEAWRSGKCDLAAAEGFIRQVAGWREYVRGVYWLRMPEYASHNGLHADRPLPDWFWTGDVNMRCLSSALRQTLDLGYAHHIQRLMVIGNFCLLAGLDVREVCDWYLAVYVDAFEWVELPNTLGMALHADNGLMASKPYAASGKYIQRQGNLCKQCIYSPAKATGEGACPFNSLYWNFIDSHQALWRKNPRMSLVLRNWERKSKEEQAAIRSWAGGEIVRLCPE